MSAVTFGQLPRELRDMIWSAAAAIQYQQVDVMFYSLADSFNMRNACTLPYVERQRQAFVGYRNLPEDVRKEWHPLKLLCYRSPGMDKMRLAVNEFQALVNRLPMATVNSEARSHALEYCRSRITCIDLVCDVDQDCGLVTVDNEIVEPIFLQPSIVTITLSWEHYYLDYHDSDYDLEDIEAAGELSIPMVFSSAKDLIDIVHRICGDGVEHIIFDSTFATSCTYEEMYWPHTLQSVIAKEDMRLVFVDDPKYDQFEVIMTPDRVAFIDNDLCSGNLYNLEELYCHLLKFYELLDASKQKLLALRTIEEEEQITCIEATVQDGDLRVHCDNVTISWHHTFAHQLFGRWQDFYEERRLKWKEESIRFMNGRKI